MPVVVVRVHPALTDEDIVWANRMLAVCTPPPRAIRGPQDLGDLRGAVDTSWVTTEVIR